MPRGAKRDVPLTERLRKAGFFKEKESFVGQDGHLYLVGWDKSRVRPLVFLKFKDRCIVCGATLHPDAPPFHKQCGAWHHTKRCDCVDCGELRCDATTGRRCHWHRTPGFKRVAEEKRKAEEDFNKLYPKGETT
jgi:hypothetical protein